MDTHAAIILGAWIYATGCAHSKGAPPFWEPPFWDMFTFALAMFIGAALR